MRLLSALYVYFLFTHTCSRAVYAEPVADQVTVGMGVSEFMGSYMGVRKVLLGVGRWGGKSTFSKGTAVGKKQ